MSLRSVMPMSPGRKADAANGKASSLPGRRQLSWLHLGGIGDAQLPSRDDVTTVGILGILELNAHPGQLITDIVGVVEILGLARDVPRRVQRLSGLFIGAVWPRHFCQHLVGLEAG